MTTHRTPPQLCPNCGELLDFATNLEPSLAPPRPGDVTLCSTCLKAWIFDDGMQLWPPTEDEAAVLEIDPRFAETLDLLIRFKREVPS